ncbi:MAG TPA: hypothetical protein PLZ52_00240 [Bacteroidales bacterium]|nr:hypothetical protein [Bacteroidales bacterium]HQL69846.1 hypothetical protein [Bacteroidales bacterium]
MNRVISNLIFFCFLCLLLSCGGKRKAEPGNTIADDKLCALIHSQQTGFSLDIPEGWHVMSTGNCNGFAFAVFDTARPEIRAFFVQSMGPVYLSLSQKKSDLELMRTYGFNITHFEMPVVDPFTPTEFVKNIYVMLQAPPCIDYQSILPAFENMEIISTEPYECPISGGETEIVRISFTRNNVVHEGLLIVSTAPDLNSSGENTSGMGYGYVLAGCCAPSDLFESNVLCLLNILESYHLDETNYKNCITGNTHRNSEIIKSGKWLGNYTPGMRSSWKNRDKETDSKLGKTNQAQAPEKKLIPYRVYTFSTFSSSIPGKNLNLRYKRATLSTSFSQ